MEVSISQNIQAKWESDFLKSKFEIMIFKHLLLQLNRKKY